MNIKQFGLLIQLLHSLHILVYVKVLFLDEYNTYILFGKTHFIEKKRLPEFKVCTADSAHLVIEKLLKERNLSIKIKFPL